MNWLLINPTQHFLKMFPLGIAYVSAALKQAGVNVRTLDLNFVDQGRAVPRALTEVLLDHPIDVIGIGGLYAEHHWIKEIVAICRDIAPHAKIVIGNGVVSCDPPLMVAHLGCDIAVVGEGEETVVALHRALVAGSDLAEIQGIAFRDGKGGVVVTPARKAIMDIDSIAMPDYEGFAVERYIDSQETLTYYGYSFMDKPRSLPILASRSCPFSCTFCYHTIATYRKRTLEHFFAEIELLVKKYQVNMVQVYDDLFAVNRERVVEFCDRIKSYNVKWLVSLRVQNIAPGKIDFPVLVQMKEAGCRVIGLGLESISPEVLTSMKKKITPEQIDYALDQITRAGLNFQGNFIFGDTAETVDTANETLDYWRRHLHYGIQTDPIWIFPGTTLYKDALASGRIAGTEEFLKLCSPVVNVCKMDEETFALMCDTLAICSMYLGGGIGQLQDLRSGSIVDGLRYNTSTSRCPHCGESSTYVDHSFWRRFVCRHCGGLFSIPIARYFGRQGKSDRSTDLLAKAVAALAAADAGGAFALARKVALEDCEDGDAKAVVAAALLQAGFAASAQPYLRRALDANPNDGFNCNNLGVCLFAANRVALALLMFRQAMELEDDIPEAAVNAKIALEFLGGDDHILDLVHDPRRPRLAIDHLQVAIPRIGKARGNVPVRQPLRIANNQLVAEAAQF